MRLDRTRFGLLQARGRIWAIAAVRGDAERLNRLWVSIAETFQQYDRVVFLGDILGPGPDNLGAIDGVLTFRRWMLAQPPFVHPDDFVVLRGTHEEMWRKLMQLHFSDDPDSVLRWMQDRQMEAVLGAYGGRIEDAFIAAGTGTVALSKWTGMVRGAVQVQSGHQEFLGMLLRAAISANGAVVFVNAGLDPDRRLAEQSDEFWWYPAGLDRLSAPYQGARLVVRGTDPDRRGVVREPYWMSLDSGCGEGGPLNAACISPDGDVLDVISV